MNAIYDTAKLYLMGYGDTGDGSPTIELSTEEVAALAESVGGTVDEIETARID